jgi:hypothetical protein
MKATLMKTLVIAIAVTGMGYYVWNANRKQQGAASEAPTPAVTASPATTESKPLSEIPVVLTDEDRKAMSNVMMLGSKSAAIMSEEDTRKMLENLKRKDLQQKAIDLAPSSKSGILINPQEIKQVIEGESVKPSEP